MSSHEVDGPKTTGGRINSFREDLTVFAHTPPSSKLPGDNDKSTAKEAEVLHNDGDSAKQPRSIIRDDLQRKLKDKTVDGTKKMFTSHNRDTSYENNGDEQDLSVAIDTDPAFNPDHLYRHKLPLPGRLPAETKSALKTGASVILHPRRTIVKKMKRSTAGRIAHAQGPFLSPEADREFLQAHEDLRLLESAQPFQNSESESESENVRHHRLKLDAVEAHRESLRVAYTTSRHIDRARTVSPDFLSYPQKDSFQEKDEQGNVVRFRWERYFGYLLLYYSRDFTSQYIDDFDILPFDIEALSRIVERVVMVSAPWQAWLMSIRRTYRWDDPWNTGKWFIIYWSLWYTEHIMGFLYGYIMYITIRNKFFPNTVESVRESVDRALDRSSHATQWRDLVLKYGQEKWLEPLLDELGPYIQLQLGDLANLLEVLFSFYSWKRARLTYATLFFFGTCLLITLLTDMRYCVKIVWFIVGGTFFFCWPISSRYPKYRYIVDPLKWVFWAIPTSAELSFEHLRADAISRLSKAESAFSDRPFSSLATDVESGTSSEDDSFYTPDSAISPQITPTIFFRAFSNDVPGRLIISTDGIRFVRSLPKKELWSHPYSELKEMRKSRGFRASKIPKFSTDELEVEFFDGTMEKMQGMKARDEAFNAILGFSGLRWQAQQLGTTA